jgi:hypothetical protein
MAIKGKKKSHSRGSQSRRQPAAAPRAAPLPRRVPWYRTDRGRLAAVGVLALIAALGWWGVDRAGDEAAALERSQALLTTYTSEARALLQTTRPAAESLAAIPARPTRSDLTRVEEEAAGWIATLRRAQTQAGEVLPTPLVINAHQLFARSVDLYLLSARTARDAATGQSSPTDTLARATEARDTASAIWLTAIQVLDRERARSEMPASGLGIPGAPAGQGLPLPGAGGNGG